MEAEEEEVRALVLNIDSRLKSVQCEERIFKRNWIEILFLHLQSLSSIMLKVLYKEN